MKYLIYEKLLNYDVVTEKWPSMLIKFAIEELKTFLVKATNVSDLESLATEKPVKIFLNCGENCKKMQDELNGAGRNRSSFKIVSLDGFIYIAGLTDHGVLYGVYELLKLLIGLEVFAKDCFKFNKCSSIELPDFEITDEADFEYRQAGFFNALKDDITANRLRIMSDNMFMEKVKYPPSGDVIGNDIYYGVWGGLWGHNMLEILPPEIGAHGKLQHEDWYSEGIQQLCLTNSKAREKFTSNLKRKIMLYPDAGVYMLGTMDNIHYCTCDMCRQSDNKYGGPSGTHIRFINHVAREIKKWQQEKMPNRNILLVAFAYLGYKRAPVLKNKDGSYVPLHPSLVMEDNTAILVAPLDMSGAHSITEPPNIPIKERFLQWNILCKRMIVWDYHIYFDDYLAFMPSLFYYKDNLEFYKRCNVFFVYSEGYVMDKSSCFHDLRLYLLSKLKWDVSANLDALIQDFCDNYYGKAAKAVLQYMDLLKLHYIKLKELYKKISKRGYCAGYETIWQPDYMTERHWPKTFLLRLERILEAPLKKNLAEPYAVRVKTELVFVKYMIIELHTSYCNQDEMLERVEEFENIIAETGLKRFKHWGWTPDLEEPNMFIRRKIDLYKARYPVFINEKE